MNPIPIARRFFITQSDSLTRFALEADPEAFADLVREFGPLVFATCRRILGATPDAEDAFQAVFLTLARRAASIRNSATLPAWLHRVALRISRKALARRRPHAPLPETAAQQGDPFAEAAWKDVRRILDEEIDRLPERLRVAVVLCLVNGATQNEAASRLGVSLNTVKRRLNAGRELLRLRLDRLGLGKLLVAAAILEPGGLRAAISPALLAVSIKLSNPKAASQSVAALAAGSGLVRYGAVIAVFASIAIALAASSGGSEPVLARAQPDRAPAPRAANPEEGEPLPKGATARFGSLRYRAPGRIYSSAVSRDGKRIALHVGNGTVRVYDAETWKLVRTFTADDGEGAWASGRNLAFSPDGRHLGFARSGKSIYILDLKTGVAGPWFGDNDRLRWNSGCTFTPDGLLGVSDRKQVYFFDPASGREVRSAPTGSIACLAPTGETFIRMADNSPGDVELILCDAKTGKELHRFEGAVRWAGGTTGFAFAPDGKSLALYSQDRKEVHLWDVNAKKKIASFPAPDEPYPEEHAEADVGFTSDGRTLFLRLKNGDIARWDVASKKEQPRLRAEGGFALGNVFALPDGKTLLTPVPTTGWVRIWNSETGNEIPVPGRYRWLANLTLSPDGRSVVMGDDTGRIDRLDSKTGKLIETLRDKGEPVGPMAFSPDGQLLAVTECQPSTHQRVGSPSRIRIVRADTGREVRKFEGEDGADKWLPTLAGFTADSRRIIMQGAPRSTAVFDVGSGKKLLSFASGSALSPDGRLIAGGDEEATKLVDVGTGKVVKSIPVAAADKIKDWAFDGCLIQWAADGRSLICARPPDLVAVLDVESGREKARFSSFPEGLPAGADYHVKQGRLLTSTVALSRDGSQALTVAFSGSVVCLWDVATKKVIARLTSDSQIGGAVFSPDGKSVFTSPYIEGGVGYCWDLEAALAAQKK